MKNNPDVPVHKRFKNPRAELMRLRALYRDVALRGAVRIRSASTLRSMRKLVGPDCAYHLYGRLTFTDDL